MRRSPVVISALLTLFLAAHSVLAVTPSEAFALELLGGTVGGVVGASLGIVAIGSIAPSLEARAARVATVITGVTLLNASTDEMLIRHDSTDVTMRQLSVDELEAYLDTGAWEGKAGAYGIQDRGDAFVTNVEGSFTNVVGFPMELIGQMLEQWGIKPQGSGEQEP